MPIKQRHQIKTTFLRDTLNPDAVLAADNAIQKDLEPLFSELTAAEEYELKLQADAAEAQEARELKPYNEMIPFYEAQDEAYEQELEEQEQFLSALEYSEEDIEDEICYQQAQADFEDEADQIKANVPDENDVDPEIVALNAYEDMEREESERNHDDYQNEIRNQNNTILKEYYKKLDRETETAAMKFDYPTATNRDFRNSAVTFFQGRQKDAEHQRHQGYKSARVAKEESHANVAHKTIRINLSRHR